MMAKRCLYNLLNISLDNRVSFSSALSESRRFLLRSLSLRSLASAVSESRQFFAACEDCATRLALSLPQRLDNRVSSSSALFEARLPTIPVSSELYIVNFMRVLSLNWNYGMCSARYWRAGASQPSRTSGSDYWRAGASRTSGSDFSIYITGAAHTVIPIQRA